MSGAEPTLQGQEAEGAFPRPIETVLSGIDNDHPGLETQFPSSY